jgi:hypothetical protein
MIPLTRGLLPQFEAAMEELVAAAPHLEQLTIMCNNAAQAFETRHLRALTPLARLSHLTLAANFHLTACAFEELAACPGLTHLTLLPSEAATGLTDAHVAGLAAITSLQQLRFPGHGRAFTGRTLGALAALPSLSLLHIASPRQQHVDYTLALPALAGVHALCSRPSAAAAPLDLDLGVPDAGFACALLRAAAGPGLARLGVSVREAADSSAIAALLAAPGAAQKLVGLDLEFKGAPSGEEFTRLASFTALERLLVTCKCVRPPPQQLDITPWAALHSLRRLHLHINPAWRAPLQPGALAALAAAWPHLEHLHLRLSAADNATHALGQLMRFTSLKSLSLQWLGQMAPEPRLCGLRRGGLRSSSSCEVPVLALGALPPGLEALSLTSINCVRLAVPSLHHLPGASSAAAAAAAGATPAVAVTVTPGSSSSSSSMAVSGSSSSSKLPLAHLTSLSIDGNFGVSDELLSGLVALVPRLSSLSLVLAGRQTLSATGLTALTALSGLRSLAVSDYREAPLSLDQSCVRRLAAGLQGLRQLQLSTPDIVHAELHPEVFMAFAKLRRLTLVGCQEQAAAALAGALPLCCLKHTPEWGAAPAAAAPAAAPEVPAVAAA